MMSYNQRFVLIEDYLSHLDDLMDGIDDQFIQSQYLGFVATSAVTVFELAIKDIFYDFSDRKHVVLGSFARAKFGRLNGRITLKSLREEHIFMFGEKYVEKFKRKIEEREGELLKNGSGSLSSSYGNIIVWRNNFVHQGQVPNTTNYSEMKNNYKLGKEVIHCLDQAMRR